MMTPTRPNTARTIGALLIGGDWACAKGDYGGLREVAQLLAAYMPEPTHRELGRLAEACNADPDLAVEMWAAFKHRRGHPD